MKKVLEHINKELENVDAWIRETSNDHRRAELLSYETELKELKRQAQSGNYAQEFIKTKVSQLKSPLN